MPVQLKKKLLSKILAMVIPIWFILMLFVVSIFGIFVPSVEKNMMAQQKQTIKQLVETSINIFSEYHRKVQSGEWSLEEAQEKAVHQVRNFRYGPEGKDYYWINDMQPEMVMHPYLPELEGKDLSNFTDPSGKKLFVACVETVRENGAGYVTYRWQWKDDPDQIVEKISYVKGFEPWGWVLGTGVYLEEVNSEIALITKRLTVISGIILLIVMGISFYLTLRTIRLETDREATFTRLAESEAMHRNFIDHAPIGMLTTNLSGEVTYLNKKLAAILKKERERLTGQSIHKVIHPDDPAELENIVFKRIEGESASDSYDIRITDFAGKPMWVKLTPESILEKTETKPDTLTGVQCFVEDITPQKESENLLRYNESRLKAILEANPDPMVVYDLNGYPEYLNPAFTSVFGWTLDELQGQTIPFLPDDQKDATHEKIKEIFEHGQSLCFETRRYTKDKHIIEVLVSAAVNKDENGSPVGMVVNLTDVTQTKALENQYKQAQRMEAMGTLAGGVAHDFNNILSGIFGHAHLAEIEIEDKERARDHIRQVVKSSQRASDLVQQILTFSRKKENAKEYLHLYIVIKEALKLIRSTIPASIEIEESIQSKGTVLADPTQMHQVLMNLCTNAYHAMIDAGGVLTVKLEEKEISGTRNSAGDSLKPGRYVVLEVSDTGQGMDEYTLEKAFEPYFTTKSRGKGTGLGLALVHAIVQEHNGHIEVKSSQGKGTGFTIYLPITEKESHSIKQQKKVNDECRGTEHIMVVDDEESIRLVTGKILEGCGYKVSVFENGQAAYDAFKANAYDYDLVFTDTAMPKMTGDELVKNIRKIRRDIPVILCTGYSEKFTEKQAEKMGINKYALKPFSGEELALTVREVLDSVRTCSKR